MGSMDAVAWPSFRQKFIHGFMWMWLIVSGYIVMKQIVAEMGYDVFRVWSFGMLTCVTTGLGAVPFLWVDAGALEDRMLALANTAAGGTMLAASVNMLFEAHGHSGKGDWQILIGLLVGVIFVRASEQLAGDGSGESDVAVLHQ